MTTLLYPDQIEHDLLHRPRRRFIVPDVLPAGPCILYGDSGVGKSGIAIRTAVTVAAGLPWAGRTVKQGCVLYVAGEDAGGVKERIVAAVRDLDLDPADIALAVIEAPDGGITGKNFERDLKEAAAKIADEFEMDMEASLIVIDTLAACFGDDSQDDARPASAVMNVLDRISRGVGCAVLAVHHTGKSGNEMRGSQVFFDRADAVIRAFRHSGSTLLEVTKMRSASSGARFAFDIGSVDLPVCGGSISVQVIRDLRSAGIASPASADEMRESRKQTDADVVFGTACRLAVNGKIGREELQLACYDAWKTKPNAAARKTAFSHALKKLQKDNLFNIKGEIVSVSVSKKTAYQNADERDGVSVSVSVPPLKGGRAYLRPGENRKESRTGTGG